MASWWDKLTGAVSGVVNSDLGDRALTLAEQYAQNELAGKTDTKNQTGVTVPTASASIVPSWVLPVGIGAGVLVLVLLLMPKGK